MGVPKKEMFAVVIITEDGQKGPELADFHEMASDTARRLFLKEFKKEASSVVACERLSHLEIKDLPSDLTVGWPAGAKTIPVYYFKTI